MNMKIDSLENNSKTNYSTKRQFVQEGKAKIEKHLLDGTHEVFA